MGDAFIYGFLILFFGVIVVGCWSNLVSAAKESKATGGSNGMAVFMLIGALAFFIWALVKVIMEAADAAK